jgi:AcrR family transcriptional regulator
MPSTRRAPQAPSKTTRLSRALAGAEPRARPTPLDAFRRARRKWLAGERIDMGALAAELGVGRATLFRWVGSRELLLGEIIWSVQQPFIERARAEVKGHGPEAVAEVCERVMRAALSLPPLRAFLERDPEYALRVLTSKDSTVQSHNIDAMRAALEEQAAAGHLRPKLPLDTLAFVIVRISEAFVYADVISGREPEVDQAAAAIRVLLE